MTIKIGRNDPCWCGSGLKYKCCHLNREKADPLQPYEFAAAQRKAYSSRYCLHPEASPDTCSGNIVKAHTIQRNGGFSLIAQNGHVYNCLTPPFTDLSEKSKPKLIGINKASTFTGFCGGHDDELFTPIEKKPFQSDAEQIFLLSYRSICRELFLKRSELNLAPTMKTLDRGATIVRQLDIQDTVDAYTMGVAKAVEDLEHLKSTCDDVYLQDNYSTVNSYVISMKNRPEIMCSAVHQPEYDFDGNVLQRLGNLHQMASWMHFSLIATDTGGAAIFSWLGDNHVCTRFVRSLNALSDHELPHAIVRYMFEFFENTYFSPSWLSTTG